MSGIYIHIPYCSSKCIYCDFYTAGARIADWHQLSLALLAEFTERSNELTEPVETIYIGGGTPSLLPNDEFSKIMTKLSENVDLSGVKEITIEVNPDDVSPDKVLAWKDSGVTRVSMGVQSFCNLELKRVGRKHTAEQAIDAYAELRRNFDNISIDLIFGLPEQSEASWRNSLRKAFELKPEHLSAYSLMYSDGTALTALRDAGRLFEANDDESSRMFLMLVDEAVKAGYDHYEISNFALPGRRSKHNSSYWTGGQYLGIGPSACSYDGARIRRSNPADVRGWISRFYLNRKELTPFYEEEQLTDDELLDEFVMTRLRMREGISVNEVESRFGSNAANRLVANAKGDITSGLLTYSAGHISLTRKGIMLSDSIILRLVE